MPRKPKGWYHRYEITRILRKHPSGTSCGWWHITHYYGKNKGAGGRLLDGDPGPDISDEDLIRRAGLHDVTVPVYVIRGNGQS